MTELQIKAAQLAEDRRHHRAEESTNRKAAEAQAQHLLTSDEYTAQHYQYSDESGRISANANAMQARTREKEYELNKSHIQASDRYTEEHYQRSDQASLINAQASAQKASTDSARYTMEHDIEYGWTGNYGYPEGMPLSAQKKTTEIALEAGAGTPRANTEQKIKEASLTTEQATAVNKYVTAVTSALNAVFGKGGIVSFID